MRYAVFIFECLNILVIYVVSFPVLVNVAHFCLGGTVCEFCVWFGLGFGGFHVSIGKELL